jgi:hypothetical protein
MPAKLSCRAATLLYYRAATALTERRPPLLSRDREEAGLRNEPRRTKHRFLVVAAP